MLKNASDLVAAVRKDGSSAPAGQKFKVFHSKNGTARIGSICRSSDGTFSVQVPDQSDGFARARGWDSCYSGFSSFDDALSFVRANSKDSGEGNIEPEEDESDEDIGEDVASEPQASEQAKFDAYVSQLVKDSLARTAVTPKQDTAPREAANTGDIGMSIKGLNDFLQLAVEGARNAWHREPGLRSEFTSAEYEGFIMALATGNIEAAATGWAREFRAAPAIRGEFITEQSYVAFKRDEFRRAERGMRRSR